MSQKARHDRRANAGFTLIEALVALALLAAGLAAIASLVATTTRGVRTMEQRVALVETARSIANMLPRPEELEGNPGGEVSGHRWQVQVSPYFGGGAAVADSPWIPQRVALRVQSPSGAIFSWETVRLRKRPNR